MYRIRFMNILIMLIISFRLLSITQNGTDWEIPQYVFNSISKYRVVLIILLCVEAIIFARNYSNFLSLSIVDKCIYATCILLIILVIVFCLNNNILNFKITNMLLSQTINLSTYWGPLISIIIYIKLTL